jgi:hypothetical protein
MDEVVQSRALVLDRWWWSTWAYGWSSGSVQRSGISESCFRELIETIWKPVVSSVVFLFLEPHDVDDNNVDGVEAGYRALAAAHPDVAVIVRTSTRT